MDQEPLAFYFILPSFCCLLHLKKKTYPSAILPPPPTVLEGIRHMAVLRLLEVWALFSVPGSYESLLGKMPFPVTRLFVVICFLCSHLEVSRIAGGQGSIEYLVAGISRASWSKQLSHYQLASNYLEFSTIFYIAVVFRGLCQGHMRLMKESRWNTRLGK